MTANETGTLPRIRTGNAALDGILGGGFPAHSINIVMGEPGTGKTILAERLIFANAVAGERPIVFLTTMSEPLDKVVRYLQQFAFFDPAMLPETIVYDTIGTELAEHGISALVPKLEQLIREVAPKIVVIDSFKAIHDLTDSMVEMRRLVHQVAGVLTAYDATAFLIGEYDESHIPRFPEFAVADSIVQLSRSKLTTHDERSLRVLKLRGSGYAEGLHSFRITSDGLDVYPRLVSPTAPPPYISLDQRLSTGVAGLDPLLGGGLPRGRSAFVVGSTGTGKTTFALQFLLEGLRHGQPGMFVHFEENPTQLDAQIHSLGFDPDDARRRGMHFVYVSPVELRIDSIVETIFRTIEREKIERVAIDAVGELLTASSDARRLHNYLYALAQHFAVRGVTSLMTHEAAHVQGEPRLSALADAIVVLGVELEPAPRRTLRIIKARGTAHGLAPVEVAIGKAGLEVRPSR